MPEKDYNAALFDGTGKFWSSTVLFGSGLQPFLSIMVPMQMMRGSRNLHFPIWKWNPYGWICQRTQLDVYDVSSTAILTIAIHVRHDIRQTTEHNVHNLLKYGWCALYTE